MQTKILEYKDDLNYFYKSSYGSEINKHIQCYTVNDMLKRLAIDDYPNVTAYFTHSAALQLFLTAMGILKDDEPLKAENYDDVFDRKWKTSEISPFAGNIAIVKYNCSNDTKIKLFLNEKLLKLDWCEANGVCDWVDFEKRYGDFDCEHLYCKL